MTSHLRLINACFLIEFYYRILSRHVTLKTTCCIYSSSQPPGDPEPSGLDNNLLPRKLRAKVRKFNCDSPKYVTNSYWTPSDFFSKVKSHPLNKKGAAFQ